MALTSGTKLGPYEIQSAIGAGGMGEMYRALDTRLNRDVAIKDPARIFFGRSRPAAAWWISLPRAPNVHIEGAQGSVQIRVELIAIAAVVEEQTSFELARKQVVRLGLSDPLRDHDF